MTSTTATSIPAMPGAGRPRPPNPLQASLTLGWRALLRVRHEPEQLTDAIAIPVLFTVLFTYLFGGGLSGSTHHYLQFLLPGTLVMAVLLITVSIGVTLSTDRASGVLDRFRSMPIWQPAVIAGDLIAAAGRYLLAIVLVLALGAAMGYRPSGGVGGVLLAAGLILVFALSVSWIWTTLGLVLRSPQSISVVSFVVQFPLIFTSNIFANPATMPRGLRAFVNANPVSHLVTAERALMNGAAAAGQAGWVLLASAALIAVFAPVTMLLYRNRP
jgi:ABC-2 type transport system permease protein